MTREEQLWAAIVAALKNEGYTGEIPERPSWRTEEFLMGILGGIKGVEGAAVPTPVWNEEKYMAAVFDQVDGGVSKCKLLGAKEYDVNTSSTTESTVGSFTVEGSYTKDHIIYVKIRDKAGKRNGYFRGSDCFVINAYAANGTTTSPTPLRMCMGVDAGGMFMPSTTAYGVYLSALSSAGSLTIKAKYNSSYGTVNGTFRVEVYALDWPNGDSIFK